MQPSGGGGDPVPHVIVDDASHDAAATAACHDGTQALPRRNDDFTVHDLDALQAFLAQSFPMMIFVVVSDNTLCTFQAIVTCLFF